MGCRSEAVQDRPVMCAQYPATTLVEPRVRGSSQNSHWGQESYFAWPIEVKKVSVGETSCILLISLV